MRELILLRHAHAEPAAPGQADIDRPLSLQGQAEAEAAGAWLRDHGYIPDRIVSSTARRTRETTELAMAALGYVEQRQDERVYDATPGRLMQVVDDHRDISRVLLVGHNPGFEQLTHVLCGTTPSYPTAALGTIELDVDTWQEVTLGSGRLVDHVTPAQLRERKA